MYQIFGLFAVLCLWYYTWQECRDCRNRRALILVLLCNIFFVAISYKHISAPYVVYLFLGGVAFPALVYGVLFNVDLLLIIAATYLPYNLVFPATFGGLQQSLNGTNIVLVCLLIGIVTGRDKVRPLPLLRDKATLMVLPFILLALIAFIRGGFFHGDIYWRAFPAKLKWFLTPFIVFLLFRQLIRDRSSIKMIFAACLILIICNIWYGLLEWVNLGFSTYAGFRRRLGGINQHPNLFGAFIAYYIFLIIAPMLVSFRKASVKTLIFPLALAIRIIVPTNSRGAWIGLPPAFFAVTFFRGKGFFVGAILLAALMVSFPNLLPNTMRGRFHEAMILRQPADILEFEHAYSAPGRFLGESQSLSIRSRGILWGGGLNMMRQRLWGYGFGVFQYLIGYYTIEQELWGTAHNMWIEIAVEMGIPALITLFLAFFFLFKSSVTVFRREKDPMLKAMALGYIGSIAALIVVNMTGNRFDAVDLITPFWIMGACVLRLHHMHIMEEATALGA